MEKSGLKNVLRVLMVVIFLMILYISRSVIKPIMLSLITAYLLNPLVKLMERKGLKKRCAVLISILILIMFFAIGIFYIIPGIIKDVLGILGNADVYKTKLSIYIEKIGYNSLPYYLKNVLDSSIVKLQNGLMKGLNNFFNELIRFTMEIPAYTLVPVFVYYFLMDKEHFINTIKGLFSPELREKMSGLWVKIDMVLGSFIRSQLILSIIISLLTFVAMLILRVRFAVIIAFINGITNLIPYFGPVIGYIPALFAALSDSFGKAIGVTAAFIIIQQFESSVIAPKLMGDSIGIHPVYIMIIIILGGKYFGGWGLLLSVPAAGVIKVLYAYAAKKLY